MHCPVASFDCPSGPRELLADGALGQLIAPGDAAGLGAAMRAMAAGTVVRPPAEAVAAHLRQFDPAVIADQYVTLVRSLLSHAAASPLQSHRLP